MYVHRRLHKHQSEPQIYMHLYLEPDSPHASTNRGICLLCVQDSRPPGIEEIAARPSYLGYCPGQHQTYKHNKSYMYVYSFDVLSVERYEKATHLYFNINDPSNGNKECACTTCTCMFTPTRCGHTETHCNKMNTPSI